MIEIADFKGSKSDFATKSRQPQASYLCANFSNAYFWKHSGPKGSIFRAFKSLSQLNNGIRASLATALPPHGSLAGATSESPNDFRATRADHRPTPSWTYFMRVTSVAVLAGARPPHGPFAGATSEALSDFRATRADHRPTPACRVLSISLPGEDCPVF